MKNNKLVAWSLGGTLVIVIIAKASKGSWPSPKIFLGLAVVYVILGFASDFAPQVAQPMAVLVFLAVLLYQGADAFYGTNKVVTGNRTRIVKAPKKGGKN